MSACVSQLSPETTQKARALRVLVVSDLRVLRESITNAIRDSSTTVVVQAACPVREALSRTRALGPDVVLLDVVRDDAAGLVKALKAASSEIRVLALGIPEVASAIVACARADFSGYVAAEASTRDLLLAIEMAAKNELHCSPKAAAYLFRHIGRSFEGLKGVAEASLTEREMEVLRLVQQGLSNKMISRRLDIGVQTVKNHIHSILSKLGVQNRAAAAALLSAQSNAREGSDRTERQR